MFRKSKWGCLHGFYPQQCLYFQCCEVKESNYQQITTNSENKSTASAHPGGCGLISVVQDRAEIILGTL